MSAMIRCFWFLASKLFFSAMAHNDATKAVVELQAIGMVMQMSQPEALKDRSDCMQSVCCSAYSCS